MEKRKLKDVWTKINKGKVKAYLPYLGKLLEIKKVVRHLWIVEAESCCGKMHQIYCDLNTIIFVETKNKNK